MPPTRGHDLKPEQSRLNMSALRDAPHTGARLETSPRLDSPKSIADAPHTGARLETYGSNQRVDEAGDAPHTGARLETLISAEHISYQLMPPTRGHDLKPVASTIVSTPLLDAPHTGARLETKRR